MNLKYVKTCIHILIKNETKLASRLNQYPTQMILI